MPRLPCRFWYELLEMLISTTIRRIGKLSQDAEKVPGHKHCACGEKHEVINHQVCVCLQRYRLRMITEGRL